MEHIVITTLEPIEWQKFKDIRLEALSLEPEAFSTSYTEVLAYPDTYWQDRIKRENQLVLVAKDENTGTIVGMLHVHLRHEGVKEDTAIFTGAYVRKEYRGQGVGKRMFQKAFKILKNNDHIKIANLWVLETRTASIAFYKSLGFEQVGEKEDALETEDGYIDELIMEKNL